MYTIYSKFILSFVFSTFLSTIYAMQPRAPDMMSKIKYNCSLYNEVPGCFKRRPFTYLKSLNEQWDEFSCGHRTLFHALAIERAVKKARRGIPLTKKLSWLLKDQKSLCDIYGKVTSYINETESDTDQSQGLYPHQILGTSQKKLPMLKDKLVPIYCETDGEITITHNPKHDQYTLFPDEYFESSEDLIHVKIKDSYELSFQLSKLKEPYDTTHFACFMNDHWVLATALLNVNYKAELIVIDSSNHDMTSNQSMITTFETLLECVEEMNKRKILN